jgi:hypothetical protein
VAKTAVLAIDIVADATDATKAFDDASRSASTAADKIDDIGGKAGDTASGLGAIAGALDAAGFGPAAEAAGLLATGLDAAEGASTLFKVAQETLTITTLKDTVAKVANTVATTAANVATKIWAAGQWLLNAALTANPIGLIIAAIAILIGIVILIATKTTWFQDIWEVAWSAIQKAAVAVWDFIVKAASVAWDLIVAGVKLYIGIWIAIFNGIKAAVKVVWDWIQDAAGVALGIVKTAIDGVKGAFDKVVDVVKSVIEQVGKITGSTLDAIKKPIELVQTAFDKVVEAIKSVVTWLGNIKMPKVLTDVVDKVGSIWPFAADAAGGGTTVPGVSSQALGRSAGAGAVTINVSVPESSDPVATARYLKALIRRGEASGVMFGMV